MYSTRTEGNLFGARNAALDSGYYAHDSSAKTCAAKKGTATNLACALCQVQVKACAKCGSPRNKGKGDGKHVCTCGRRLAKGGCLESVISPRVASVHVRKGRLDYNSDASAALGRTDAPLTGTMPIPLCISPPLSRSQREGEGASLRDVRRLAVVFDRLTDYYVVVEQRRKPIGFAIRKLNK